MRSKIKQEGQSIAKVTPEGAIGTMVGASAGVAAIKESTKKEEDTSMVKAKSGDSIWKILKENGIKTNTENIEAFKTANGLKDNTIQAGAEYKLPSAEKAEAKIDGASILKAPTYGASKASIKELQKKIGATVDG